MDIWSHLLGMLDEDGDTEGKNGVFSIREAVLNPDMKVALAALAVTAAVAAALLLGAYVIGLGEQVGAPADGQGADGFGGGDELEMRSGTVRADSENATADAESLKATVREHGGDVVGETRDETPHRVRHTVRARVSEDDFSDAVEVVEGRYDVTDVRVSYTTTSVSEARNEIRVLTDSMRRYERLLDRYDPKNVTGGELDRDAIDTISRLTDERLRLARELNDLNYDVERKEERASLSSIEVTFLEERDAPLVPDDTAGEVRRGVRYGVSSVSDNVAKVVALPFTAVSVLLTAFRYVVYAGAAALPPVLVYAGVVRLGVVESPRTVVEENEESAGKEE